ncbi:YbjN domain-containing protein [Catenulispora pinisilvae]|uniref:YbjN domain-containing protein n=1 Tax=Catenulispora pinisilvae TaxID=2705253 RepID=UPI001890ED78|nr:YbjN domain-containing protein [Catenulispora pinisilvae]
MTIDPGAIPNFGPQEPPQGPPPIIKPDAKLIGDLFEQVGIKYGTDEEGDTVASWPGFRLYAMFRGEAKELFAIRAFYERAYPLEEKQELLDVIDEWNRDSLWPKVYTHTNEEGVLRLVGESQMVVPQGVNVDFFVGSVMNWVQASIGFHSWLAERLGLEVEVDSVGQGDDGDSDDDADSGGSGGSED